MARLRTAPAAGTPLTDDRNPHPGVCRGIWHVPFVRSAGFVVPLLLAFLYTWLYNETTSVLLCVLLHASLTPAQDHQLLTPDSPTVDVVLLGSYVAAVAVVIVASRGRLGQHQGGAAVAGRQDS